MNNSIQSLVKVQQPRPRIAVLDVGVGEEGSEEEDRQRNGIRGIACSPVLQSLSEPPLAASFSASFAAQKESRDGPTYLSHCPVLHVVLRDLLGLTVSSLWD